MPRSNHSDHFTAKNSPVTEMPEPTTHAHRAERVESVHKVHGKHAGAKEVHYGHAFGKTEEILHERAVHHAEVEHDKQAHAPSPSTAPIGSVPAVEAATPEAKATSSAFPSPALISVWTEAQRTAETALRAGKEALSAAYKLGTLPLEAARIVAHDLRGLLSLR